MNNDLISREALLEWVKNQKAEATGVYGNIIAASINAVMQHNVANAIRKAPTVDAEPVRHGRWGTSEIVGYDGVNAIWARQCSKCGYENRYYITRYCPNCGARMDGK